MRPISVLVVDASPAFLRLAVRLLEGLDPGHVLVAGTARSGEEGLALAERLRPQVVLVEVAPPGAAEIVRRFRERLPSAGLVALARGRVAEERQAALDAGADEFILKARLGTDLWPAIRRAAARS